MRRGQRIALEFRGRRPGQGGRPASEYRAACVCEVRRADGRWEPLDPRHDLRYHCPTGFEWGYRGSGPAQLALALCTAVVTDTWAQLAYQGVKASLVAVLPFEGWNVAADVVYGHVIAALDPARLDAVPAVSEEGGA